MKKNILLLFGGQSTEHDISLRSATTILTHIDREKYDVYAVGITKEGKWLLYQGQNENLITHQWETQGIPAILSPDATHKGLWLVKESGENVFISIDAVFPILHGKYGEDGTVQGLCQLAQIPFVGCGVAASAISMDKAFTKVIADKAGVPQAKYVLVKRAECENMDRVILKVERALPYPYFVKPANTGSSVGVSKATNRQELVDALYMAAQYDTKILVEETIVGREVETAVLGNENFIVSGVGEIVAGAAFYDFDAKYNSAESKTIVDADLPEEIKDEIRSYARDVFKAVSGKGFARIDFFVKEDGKVIFNEINTIPGFTSISMYPMLFEAEGIPIKEIITRLIEGATLD